MAIFKQKDETLNEAGQVDKYLDQPSELPQQIRAKLKADHGIEVIKAYAFVD